MLFLSLFFFFFVVVAELFFQSSSSFLFPVLFCLLSRLHQTTTVNCLAFPIGCAGEQRNADMYPVPTLSDLKRVNLVCINTQTHTHTDLHSTPVAVPSCLYTRHLDSQECWSHLTVGWRWTDKWHGIARRIKPWGNLAIDLLWGYFCCSLLNPALMKRQALSHLQVA